jgi:hypothetical protein
MSSLWVAELGAIPLSCWKVVIMSLSGRYRGAKSCAVATNTPGPGPAPYRSGDRWHQVGHILELRVGEVGSGWDMTVTRAVYSEQRHASSGRRHVGLVERRGGPSGTKALAEPPMAPERTNTAAQVSTGCLWTQRSAIMAPLLRPNKNLRSGSNTVARGGAPTLVAA